MIAKWELALETSYKTIRKILAESVGPALERIVLLLEELIGWSQVCVLPSRPVLIAVTSSRI